MPGPPTRRRRATRGRVTRSLGVAWTEAYRDLTKEWLEADGLGGYASGCASGIRTRRYHALLLSALNPPDGRHALVAGVEVAIETRAGRFALSSHRYDGDVVYPDGAARIIGFSDRPWPRWRFRLDGTAQVEHELFVPKHCAAVVLRWTGSHVVAPARLSVRPLLSVRDAHALTHENDAFRFTPNIAGGCVTWTPYDGLPKIAAFSNGGYVHEPDWFRRFFYVEERARGLDAVEDLASPGTFVFDLAGGPAVLAFAAESAAIASEAMDAMRRAASVPEARRGVRIAAAACALATAEARRRRRFGTRLRRAADAYIVRRGAGLSVIAGYPWFGEWGRDTFVALRGLLLA